MRNAVVTSLALLLLCASTVAGADISGKWHAQVPWPGRNLTDFYFTFKVDGAKLTGTATYPLGDSAFRVDIMEGKAGGDDVSFVLVTKRGNTEARQIYKGKVVGNVINFTMETPQASPAGGPPPAGQAGGPPPAGQAAGAPPAGQAAAPPVVVEFTAKKVGP